MSSFYLYLNGSKIEFADSDAIRNYAFDLVKTEILYQENDMNKIEEIIEFLLESSDKIFWNYLREKYDIYHKTY